MEGLGVGVGGAGILAPQVALAKPLGGRVSRGLWEGTTRSPHACAASPTCSHSPSSRLCPV